MRSGVRTSLCLLLSLFLFFCLPQALLQYSIYLHQSSTLPLLLLSASPSSSFFFWFFFLLHLLPSPPPLLLLLLLLSSPPLLLSSSSSSQNGQTEERDLRLRLLPSVSLPFISSRFSLSFSFSFFLFHAIFPPDLIS